MCENKIDPATAAKLTRGELIIETKDVAGSAVPAIHVKAILDAPPERVWELIDRVGDFQHNMAGVKRSAELSREGDRVRARLTVGMPFPLRDLTSVTDAIHTVIPGERYQREWHLVEGDYRVNGGRWTLYPHVQDRTRTLAIYILHAEPLIPVPLAIQRLVAAKAVPRLFAHLRRRVR